MPAGKRKRKATQSSKDQAQERKRKVNEHAATIAALKPRFMGLDENQVVSARHPLELKYSNISLNSLQRAMVFCMNFCGGAASDDELEAFCSVYWRAIEQKSERRSEYSGAPTKRIFKIIFSIKKNGLPLFVESSEDKSKHQVYVPHKQFQDIILDLLRDKEDGYTLSELTELMKDGDYDGFFKDLPCSRRVRAQLLVYRRQEIVEYSPDTDKWTIKVSKPRPKITSTLPDFLKDLQPKNLTLSELYDEIQRRMAKP